MKKFGFAGTIRKVLTGAALTATLLIPQPAKAATSLRADGTILLNNQPYFPFGFYHVAYGYPKASRLADMDTMADAGFNCIFTPIDNGDSALFNKATARGMGVFVEFADPNDTIATQTNLWKNQPNLLGWTAFDDVDNGQKTPTGVAAVNAQIKAADPNHLVYVSGGYVHPDSQTPPRHDVIGNYMNTSDLIALQNYPIPYEPLATASNSFKDFFDAAPANKSLLANCQAFRWDDGSSYLRAPNALEARNMTYQAYINGMKGIIFYTFYHPTAVGPWKITSSTALWNEMKLLAAENTQLRDVLLNGQIFRKIDTGALRYDVVCSGWAYQGRFYFMIANLTNNSKNFSLALPTGTGGAMLPFFPVSAHNPATMSFNAATRVVSGPIGNKQVQVYSVACSN